MKKKIERSAECLGLIISLLVLMSTFAFAVDGVDYGPKYLSPSQEVITPHIPWLKPYKKGPLKVLFITYRTNGGMREVVELAQRMDIDYTVFPLHTTDRFWVTDTKWHCSTLTTELLEKDLKEKLQGNYDLIILGDIHWSVLPLSCRFQILKKIKEGTSLLGVVGKMDEYLEKVTNEKKPINLSFLLPYKGLPAFDRYPDFNSFLNSTLEMSEFGKGKIILLKGYSIPGLQSLTPPSGEPLKVKLVEYDYYLAYIIHLILFAADKQPDVMIKGTDYIKAERENFPPVEFLLESEEKKSLSCHFTLRNKDNEVFISQEKRISLSPGETRIGFNIGKVPAGKYFADLWVKEEEKTINFGSSFLEVGSNSFIQEIDIKKSYKKEEEIKGKVVVFTKTGEENLNVKITQKDNFGRITNKKIVPLGKEGIFEKEASFSLRPTTPLSIIQYLDVELLKDKEVLDKKKIIFSISNLYPKDDVRYILWVDPLLYPRHHHSSYLTHYLLSEIYKAGFDTSYSVFSEAVPLANLHNIPIATRFFRFFDRKTDWYPHPDIPNRTKDDHIRMPCLTDPEYLRKEEERLTSVAERGKSFSTIEFSMGDECFFVHGSFELCFSPTCVAKFHQFLKEEYGSLENLNKEYESNYTSFDEVKPVTLEDVKENPKLIPLWVDYRRHMESTWAGIYSFARDTIQRTVPEAKTGYEGSDTQINSFRAADFYKLSQAMSLNNTYDRPFLDHAVADFAHPGTLLGLGWYGGYNWYRSSPFNRYISWRHLFRGANSFWVFKGGPGGGPGVDISVIASDISFYDFFKENIKEVKEMKKGIGKLLICSKRENDKIGILYSASSVHSSTLTPELPSMENVLNSLAILFEDSGYQFQVISYKQLEEGILNKEDFRVLFLPFCQSISEKEAAEITLFVKKGGTVIADLRPGVSDEHGKPYKKGALDEVFGVEQNTKSPEVKKVEVSIRDINFPERFPLTSLDSSLKLSSGQAKAWAEGTPALIVNNYGKGTAILLNFSLSNYIYMKGTLTMLSAMVNYTEDTPIIKNFFKALLSFAGIKEEAKITPEIPGLREYRFASGNLQYLGLLQELPEPAMNYATGVAKPLSSSSATVSLSKKYHIYNIREGKYVGYSDKIRTMIEPAKAELYGLLPYKVSEIKITIPSYVNQGDDLEYEVNLKLEKGIPGLHIIHCSLISPEGKEIEYYSENLKAERGKVVGKIPLSLNETPGCWKIRIKDIASGKTTEKTFIVKETK